MDKKTLLIILIILIISNLIFFIFYLDIDLTEAGIDFPSNSEKGFVSRVIDGDTVVINGESVRLLSIDTDERGGECYNEAKERLEELILNKEVILEKDVRDKDQYRRYLRYLFLEDSEGNINVNLKLVEEGLAIARFYEDKKYKEEILRAEYNARNNKIGCKWVNIE